MLNYSFAFDKVFHTYSLLLKTNICQFFSFFATEACILINNNKLVSLLEIRYCMTALLVTITEPINYETGKTSTKFLINSAYSGRDERDKADYPLK